MPPNEKKRKLSAFSDTEITQLLASLIGFQDKSPDVSLEGDKEIVHLVDKLKAALSQVKVLVNSFVTPETRTDE